MKEVLEALKELRNYKPEKTWVEEYNKKYNQVLKDHNLDINFQGAYTRTTKNNINVIYKNTVKGLNFKKNGRPAGYYFIISGFDEPKQKFQIGVGSTFVEETLENSSEELLEFLEYFPFRKVIDKYPLKASSIVDFIAYPYPEYIDLDTITVEKFENILKDYIDIIGKYPEVMKEYINIHETSFEKEYEKYWEGRPLYGKENGKLFATFIWSLAKEEKGINTIFFEEKENDELEEDLNEEIGKNVILYGVPGSGKSFYIKNDILKNVPTYRQERIVFYPEYMYSDFVGQYAPKNDGSGLEFKAGPFARILKKALEDPSHSYYLIMEEMNRGNAEAIFGDILQILDRPNGESEYIIQNEELKNYLNKEKELVSGIYLPKNLFLYATINNSDQNVFTLDNAFTRRWEFLGMPCNPEKKEETKDYFECKIKGTNYLWNNLRKKINKKILDSESIYNKEEKQLGLFWIERDFLAMETSDNEDEIEYRRKFASKLFRYLWVSVFKNQKEEMFYLENYQNLDEFITRFVETGSIKNLLKIEMNENND